MREAFLNSALARSESAQIMSECLAKPAEA
jgi:hypothetical protein